MKTASNDVEFSKYYCDGPIYLDASALVKLYIQEDGSDRLDEVLDNRNDLLISDLGITEIISAFARRQREDCFPADAAGRLHVKILADVEDGIYQVVQLLPSIHREAERWLLALNEHPLRTGDALHLALASTAEARTILTFDRRLAEAARRIGLLAVPVRITP